MSDVVERAKAFTGEFARPGNVWRMEARELVTELVAEVERLRADVAKVTAVLRQREPLRDDQWVKGYHAALSDVEALSQLDEGDR